MFLKIFTDYKLMHTFHMLFLIKKMYLYIFCSFIIYFLAFVARQKLNSIMASYFMGKEVSSFLYLQQFASHDIKTW